MSMQAKNRLFDILKAIVLIIFMIICLFPFYWIIMLSLKTNVDAFSIPPKLFFTPTFQHYEKLVVQADFMKYFINSLITSLIGVGLAAIIGVPAAYTFSKTTFKGDHFLYMMLLISRVTPGVVFIVPLPGIPKVEFDR